MLTRQVALSSLSRKAQFSSVDTVLTRHRRFV